MFAALGGFIGRYWPAVTVAWGMVLAGLLLWAPPIDSVRSRDDTSFLPADSPSRQAADAIHRNFAKSTPGQSLAAPAGLAVVTDACKATLTWKPADGAKGYRVLGGAGPTAWQAEYRPLAAEPVAQPTFTDTAPASGKLNFYRVRAVDEQGREGPESALVRAQPGRPFGLVCSVLAADRCELAWQANPEPDVVGYNVYRLPAAGVGKQGWGFAARNWPTAPRFDRLTDAPVPGTSFTDTKVNLAADGDDGFCYRVTAVNRLGVESGPSPFAITIPSDPLSLAVADLDDGTCRLSWKPNPEKSIKGYVVYRISRRESDRATSRLTPQPVAGAAYHDTSDPGRKVRRYIIAAVDCLGQEGVSSNSVFGQFAHRRN